MNRWFIKFFTEQTPRAVVLRTIASNSIIYLINFITFIIVARILGPEERGKLVYISLISMFVSALLTFGFLPTLKFALASGNEKLDNIFSAGIAVMMVLNIGMAALVVGLWNIGLLGKTGNALSAEHISYFCLLLFTTNIFSLLHNLALGSSQFDFSNTVSMLRNILVVPGMWMLVVVLSFGLEGAILAHIFSYLGSCLYIFWAWRKKVSWHIANPLPLIKKYASYARSVWIASMATSLSSRLDQYIVAMFINSRDLGLYSAAVQFADQILFLPSATDNVFFNKSAQFKNTGEKLIFFDRFVSSMWWFTLASGVLYSVLVYFLIPVLLGSAFEESSRIFLWYGAGMILWVVPKFYLKLFSSSDLIGVSANIILWNTVLMLCAYPFLGYYLGIMGIASFAVFSSLFCGVACVLAYRRHFGRWPVLQWDIHAMANNIYRSIQFKT